MGQTKQKNNQYHGGAWTSGCPNACQVLGNLISQDPGILRQSCTCLKITQHNGESEESAANS